jgi:glycosyltransferase involved in cell wall biosynthesis
MPVFNYAPYLNEAVDCILYQTFTDFEFIILNDGSTDSSEVIIENYAREDKRIVFINDTTNRGFIYRLNQGLRLAKGEFIARTDGDDICVLDRFEKQVKYLEANQNVTLCSAWYEYFGTRDGVVTLPLKHEDIKVYLLENSSIVHALIMFRRSFFLEYKLEYDPQALACEDYDLWTRIAGKATFANLPEVMLKYRMHPAQTSTQQADIQWGNSDKCRVRMLSYIWDLKSEEDKKLAGLIARPSAISNIEDVEMILKVLDRLVQHNKEMNFYDIAGFDAYVKKKKSDLLRYFYHNKSSYNIKVFSELMRSSIAFKRELSLIEKIKVITKCLILWEKKAQIISL